MSEPIVEQIAQELETRLVNVKRESGFNQDLTVIRPSRIGTDTVYDGLAILQQEDPQSDDEIGEHGVLAGNPAAQGWNQTFLIQLFSRRREADKTAAETIVNRLWADAVKAITRQGESDAATWHTFGDVARNAFISQPSLGIWESDKATAVIEFRVLVQYRTQENDPYTGR